MRLAPKGFHHVALRAKDVAGAAAFYRGVLGLQEVRRRPSGRVLESVWFKVGRGVLMIERRLRGRGAASGSGHLVAFRVKALASWQARLARLGIRIDDRTDDTLYVRDPDGHRIGLSVYPLGRSSGPEIRGKPAARARVGPARPRRFPKAG